MSDEEVQDFLSRELTLNVATIGPSGHPHIVAMWFGLVDGKIVFWTFGKSQKIVNLRRDPKMSGLVEAGESYNELRGVELIGEGRIVEDFDEIVAIGAAVALKARGPDAVGDTAMEFIRKQAAKRVGVVFEVDKIVSWDHSKLGGTY